MNIFNVFALMIVGYVIVEVVKVWRGGKNQKPDNSTFQELFGDGWDESQKVKAMHAEIDALKDRVATLEAIVTDDKYQLNKEINKL